MRNDPVSLCEGAHGGFGFLKEVEKVELPIIASQVLHPEEVVAIEVEGDRVLSENYLRTIGGVSIGLQHVGIQVT
jgi:hypothetical protein